MIVLMISMTNLFHSPVVTIQVTDQQRPLDENCHPEWNNLLPNSNNRSLRYLKFPSGFFTNLLR